MVAHSTGRLREGLLGERPEASAQLSLPLDHPVVAELKQLDLERLSPREALEKLYAWQGEHAAH